MVKIVEVFSYQEVVRKKLTYQVAVNHNSIASTHHKLERIILSSFGVQYILRKGYLLLNRPLKTIP